MTKEEFFKYRDKAKNTYDNAHAKALKLYALGETDSSKFDKGMLTQVVVQKFSLHEYDISTIIQYAQAAQELLDSLQIPVLNPTYEIEVESYYDNADIESEGILIQEMIVATYNDNIWKNEVRNWFKNELKPKGVYSSRIVDCKLMDLFKDGTLDFKTLQKLVYSDCEL